MKKRTYEKPTCKVVQLKHRTMLLAGSSPDAPDHDDWLGYNSGNMNNLA
jgi:hypothetical protein